MAMTVEHAKNLVECYASERWGRAYGYKDPIYAGGWHRGQDIRKQNSTRAYSVSHDSITICGGKVVYVGRPNGKIELTIVIDTGRSKGRYEFHSHQAGAVVKVGDRVAAGEKIARTALSHEKPGTSWGGPHDHVVFSNYSDGSWNTSRPVVDPRPIIRAQVAAAQEALKPPAPKPAPASKPEPAVPVTPAPAPTQEEGDMVVYVRPDGTKEVYELIEGKKRRVSTIEWKIIKTAYERAGRGLPYSSGKVTSAQLDTIPTAK